jgi:hypothetical protein
MQLLMAKKKSRYTKEDTSLDVRNYIVKDDENNDHSLTFTIIDKTQPTQQQQTKICKHYIPHLISSRDL